MAPRSFREFLEAYRGSLEGFAEDSWGERTQRHLRV